MYNRYIRNDAGVYQRIPAEESVPPPGQERTGPQPNQQGQPNQHDQQGPRPSGPASSGARADGKKGFLSGLLGKLKLDEIDTGDLLLLVILFLLFKDGEDEELLIALGLLLIL